MQKKIENLFYKLGIRSDKVMHCIVGCFVSLFFGFLTYWWLGLAFAMLAGLGKELYDEMDYGLFDTKDMLATWAGGCLGAVIVWALPMI